MATTNKVGTVVLITIGGNELVGELSTSLATAVNLIEISSKASGRASNFEYGRIADTVSVSSIATTNGAATEETWKALHDALVAGTKVAVVITEYDAPGGTAVVGAVNISGSALIGNLTEEIPDNDRMTYSCDLTFDGAITKSVNV
jgi:hypothetical protein